MALTTTPSAGGLYKTFRGTVQEVLDALDSETWSRFIGFHILDNTGAGVAWAFVKAK